MCRCVRWVRRQRQSATIESNDKWLVSNGCRDNGENVIKINREEESNERNSNGYNTQKNIIERLSVNFENHASMCVRVCVSMREGT